VSYMFLWQPSECVHLIYDCVMLFSENKYDDDDPRCWLNAVHCGMQLWCAAGVDLRGWQDASSPASSNDDNSISFSRQSANSTSDVCVSHCSIQDIYNL